MCVCVFARARIICTRNIYLLICAYVRMWALVYTRTHARTHARTIPGEPLSKICSICFLNCFSSCLRMRSPSLTRFFSVSRASLMPVRISQPSASYYCSLVLHKSTTALTFENLFLEDRPKLCPAAAGLRVHAPEPQTTLLPRPPWLLRGALPAFKRRWRRRRRRRRRQRISGVLR